MTSCSATISAGRPTQPEAARLDVYKALCDLLSGLWALIQQANGNRGADFATYAESRLRALPAADVGSADFPPMVDARADGLRQARAAA